MDTISYSLAAKAYKEALSKAALEGSAVLIPDGGTADRPTLTANDRAIRYNTDTGGLEEWNGTTWKNVSADITAVRLKGTDTEANILAMVSMVAEDLWIASDTLNSWVYDGTNWVNIGPLQGPEGVQGIAGSAWLTGAIDPVAEGVDNDMYLNTTSSDYFKKVAGVWQLVGNLKGVTGDTGNSITSMSKTGTVGNVDTYTVWQDAAESVSLGSFSVYNGQDGLGLIRSIVAGNNVTINNTDPNNPIINAEAGSEFYNQESEPVPNRLGAVWYKPSEELAYLYVNDGTTDLWVELSGAGGTASLIHTPIITTPLNGAVDFASDIETTAYSTVGVFAGPHTGTKLELASDVGFTNVVYANTYGAVTSLDWPVENFDNQVLYARVQYLSDYIESKWSNTVSFTTTDKYVGTPTMTIGGNISELKLTPTISLSAFNVFNGSDIHVSTDYQVVDKATGVVKWESLGNTVDKLEITTEQLDIQTEYTFRARFNGQTYGSSSWVELDGTTINIYVVTPTLTVSGYPLDIGKNPTLTTSAFTIYNGSDTHLSTDYQILKNNGGSLVWESLGNTVDKITINSGDLVDSTEYRFRVRHNSTNYGSSAWIEVIGTTKEVSYFTYGVNWNPTTDTYERTGEASSAPLSSSYPGLIQTQMKRCVLNANGTVKYFLDPNDSTKKADGTTAIIDGTDGNVMVQIPKFWYKYEFADGKHKWLISEGEQPGFEVHPAFDREGTIRDFRYYPAYQGFTLSGKLISGSGRLPTADKTRAAFRTEAAANGIGWSQIDWNLLAAVQLLYLTEYADFDTQAMLGQGHTSAAAGNYTAVTGSSNSLGNASSPSTNTGDQFMSYRGIENWYGQIMKFIDGVNVKDREYFVNKKPSTYADDVFTGDYVTTTITRPVTASGYVKNIVQNKNGFVSSDVSGTDSTYIPDRQQNSASGRFVISFGGYASRNLFAGGFNIYSSFSSDIQDAAFGSAVSY